VKGWNGKEFIRIALPHMNIQVAKFIVSMIVLLGREKIVACPFSSLFDKNVQLFCYFPQ
jgi:hypothetical protein